MRDIEFVYINVFNFADISPRFDFYILEFVQKWLDQDLNKMCALVLQYIQVMHTSVGVVFHSWDSC